MNKDTRLETTKVCENWYLSRGHINGKFCIGYGHTIAEAINDAYKDYEIIINLQSK